MRSSDSPAPSVAAVSCSAEHTFTKHTRDVIQLRAGLGVADDAHLGTTVKHRSRVARDPTQPNLRQVHLIPGETHDELAAAGFEVRAGEMGENVTTRGLDLHGLPTGTRLRLGVSAVIEITGLRNPCKQLDGLQKGLLQATLEQAGDGTLIRKAGVMAIVTHDGAVRPGDPIDVELPSAPFEPLVPV